MTRKYVVINLRNYGEHNTFSKYINGMNDLLNLIKMNYSAWPSSSLAYWKIRLLLSYLSWSAFWQINANAGINGEIMIMSHIITYHLFLGMHFGTDPAVKLVTITIATTTAGDITTAVFTTTRINVKCHTMIINFTRKKSLPNPRTITKDKT